MMLIKTVQALNQNCLGKEFLQISGMDSQKVTTTENLNEEQNSTQQQDSC